MQLPRQRTAQMPHVFSTLGAHAVVLGASMSGLLAARVLAERFDLVTVVERDLLTGEPAPRRGVPQARHAHVLLPRGARALDELLPGFLEELRDAGVPVANTLDQFHLVFNGHRLFHDGATDVARRRDGGMYGPSRPFLEARVLQRVRELPNVRVLDGVDVEGLTWDRSGNRVTGAQVAPRDRALGERHLEADLVVVATGRGARVPAWLEKHGYRAPEEDRVAIGGKYVSARVRLPADSVGQLRSLLVGPTAVRPTGAGAFLQEGGHWMVTFAGYRGHHPPLEHAEWLSFGAGFLPRDFATALAAGEPLGPLQQYRIDSNLRRRYDKLGQFPEGLVVFGDALCSFNPVYGQGMTVAALEALALGDCLREGSHHLAHRFFKAAAKPIGDAWRFAVGSDLSMPEAIVPGQRHLPDRLVNAYVDRFQAAAETDPVLAWRFLDVTGFDEPVASLFSADSLRRIASDSQRRRRTVVPVGD